MPQAPVANELSRRERIMAAIKVLFVDMCEGVDGYTTTWDRVRRSPIDSFDATMRSSIAILDTRELKNTDVHDLTRSTLRVIFEVKYHLRTGDEPSTELNRLILDVQRKIKEDTNLGGLTLNVTETGNDLDIEGHQDNIVTAVVFVDILYRHVTSDPRRGI